ncbi:sugar ABC transporter substrate-binding protein [Aquibium sp. LZ166]|uniref:Sugar ABC transporter substrate-binding protein n=1 Tax=Aquibium pacificus TaxID=3153579 RepID=A0ABV3SDB4_9HYPH
MRKFKALLVAGGLASTAFFAAQAAAFELGVVAFQMSAETQARCANTVGAEAEKLGWEAQVLNSNGALETHASQLDNLIQKGVDGLILCMSKPVEFDAQFKAAKDAGIPVITISSGASPHTLFDVTPNEYIMAAEAAIYLLGTINFEGNVLLQRFESNTGARIRGSVLNAVLAENPAVKVVGEHSMARTKSWQDDVRNGMSALILQNAGNFDGVWASFDGQALIIDDLLKESGLNKGDVSLVSIDGGQEVYRRIKDPESMMTATVAIPFEDMASKAVNMMNQIAVEGKSKEELVPGPYLFIPATLVDKSNVDEFLQ